MKKTYIPERNDIIWLDFEPTKGKEIGKYRPAIVLSSKNYNMEKGLVICCPISTSVRGHKIEVPIDNLDQPSVVIPNGIRAMSWKARNLKFITQADDGVMKAVLQRIIPLIGADKILLESTGISR
jgi:mRNA interferase MazF